MTNGQAPLAGAHDVPLAPVRGRDRIEVIDALRGIAILGIFYMNIPLMAGPMWLMEADIRAMGWSPVDQTVWSVIEVIASGTQRGMLEFLFGAGLMVTAAKAMLPDGPVAVADLYIRRNLWLLAFGLIDVYLLLWPGDILTGYALCALALFPFRKMRVRWLTVIGLTFALVQLVGGAVEYKGRIDLIASHEQVVAKQAKGEALTKADKETVKQWAEIEKRISGKDPKIAKRAQEEAKARNGTFSDYAKLWYDTYHFLIQQGMLLFTVVEAFLAMLLGIALWKIGFIQGRRTLREYLITMLLAYAFGMLARYIGVTERLSFSAIPKSIWATQELARLSVSLGHVALINLLFKLSAGRSLLKPFLAAGQMAFTLYLMEQFIGIFIMFSPFGMHLPGGQGWAHLAMQATVVVLILLVFANVWMRFFVSGPLEWVWRSLAYNQRQPFRRRTA